jgi:hypothetical protein
MRTIIIAAGEGTRWRNFRDTPKHLVEVEGERLLDRTVRQFLEHGEVFVAGHDERYKVDGAELFHPPRRDAWKEASKFLDTQTIWNQDGRTVVAYGDVWFSDDAVKTIADYESKDWVLFARFGLSEITGGGSECFAQSFWPEHIKEHRTALLQIAKYRSERKLSRCGGWEHYRQMNGIPLKEHSIGDRFVSIDDWTDDFDYPDDLTRWEERRAELCS